MTAGYTGRRCPRCSGTGREPGQMDGARETCGACGGCGEEWGDLDDDGPPAVKEPPE
jgi:hypothetical protein